MCQRSRCHEGRGCCEENAECQKFHCRMKCTCIQYRTSTVQGAGKQDKWSVEDELNDGGLNLSSVACSLRFYVRRRLKVESVSCLLSLNFPGRFPLKHLMNTDNSLTFLERFEEPDVLQKDSSTRRYGTPVPYSSSLILWLSFLHDTTGMIHVHSLNVCTLYKSVSS